MSLMALLQSAQGGNGLAQIAQSFGLDERSVQSLSEQFAPAIASGMKQRAAQDGGLGTVLESLKGQGAARAFEDPTVAATPETRAQGETFLAQIFGDSAASGEIASAAAQKSGVSVDMAAALLPAVAAMLQGGMQKAAPDEEIEAARVGLHAQGGDTAGAGLGDLMGMLGGGAGGLLGGLMGALGGAKQPAAGGGQLGGLLAMLDSDGDGSPLDDIVGKFLK